MKNGKRVFGAKTQILCSLLSALVSIVPAPLASELSVSWKDDHLTVEGSPCLAGKPLDIWYMEAFCRSNSTLQDWDKTVIPHKTLLLSSSKKHLRFRTMVSTNVEVLHEVKARNDHIDLTFKIKNKTTLPIDLEWFQPACIRVDTFTGLQQSNYATRSFIFTADGLTTLDKTRRREEAHYRGGQVFVPKGIDLASVNPRPISESNPVNGLIGCFSADDKYLLATASDRTHELFEGVLICLHSDPRIGGLKPRETKKIRSTIYLMRNDPSALLARYRRDFPQPRKSGSLSF